MAANYFSRVLGTMASLQDLSDDEQTTYRVGGRDPSPEQRRTEPLTSVEWLFLTTKTDRLFSRN